MAKVDRRLAVLLPLCGMGDQGIESSRYEGGSRLPIGGCSLVCRAQGLAVGALWKL